MRNFFGEQGRTRVYDEAYCSYVEKVNPRRTQFVGKMAISGWKLTTFAAERRWNRRQLLLQQVKWRIV
jgi:hypothetical protein